MNSYTHLIHPCLTCLIVLLCAVGVLAPTKPQPRKIEYWAPWFRWWAQELDSGGTFVEIDKPKNFTELQAIIAHKREDVVLRTVLQAAMSLWNRLVNLHHDYIKPFKVVLRNDATVGCQFYNNCVFSGVFDCQCALLAVFSYPKEASFRKEGTQLVVALREYLRLAHSHVEGDSFALRGGEGAWLNLHELGHKPLKSLAETCGGQGTLNIPDINEMTLERLAGIAWDARWSLHPNPNPTPNERFIDLGAIPVHRYVHYVITGQPYISPQ